MAAYSGCLNQRYLLCWDFFFRGFVDPDQIRLAPAAGESAPSTGMQLTGLVVNLGTALEDFNGLAAMALVEVGAFYWTVLAPDIVNPGWEDRFSIQL